MCRRRGFTLLELLMVVIIISILASIALPQYLRMAERTRVTEALTVLAAIRSSELRFKAQDSSGRYTTAINELDVDIPGFNTIPKSVLWEYAITTAVTGSDGVATRLPPAGAYVNQKVLIDLDSGVICATDPIYGLQVVTGDCS